MLNKGLFDLSFLESSDEEDDILNAELTESDNEFDYKCPSNHPEEHFDAANSGNHEIPVPGGDKETPTAKTADGEMGPKPAGLSEKPAAKPADGETGVPSAGSVTLDVDTYNAALDQLKKSFKEGYELLEYVTSANVVPETIEDKQERFVEEAIFAAYEDGPLFEAVQRSDKHSIKKITRQIRKPVIAKLKEMGCVFQKLSFSDRRKQSNPKAASTHLSQYAWQIIGLMKAPRGKSKSIIDAINKEFADKLGGYKIIGVRYANIAQTSTETVDPNQEGIGKMNQWLLIVDKSAPAELKAAVGPAKPVKESAGECDEGECDDDDKDEKDDKKDKDDKDDKDDIEECNDVK